MDVRMEPLHEIASRFHDTDVRIGHVPEESKETNLMADLIRRPEEHIRPRRERDPPAEQPSMPQ